MNREKHWFVRATLFSKKFFPWILKNNEKTDIKIQKIFKKSYQKSLNFTGLNLTCFDILHLSYTTAFLSFIGLFLIDLFIILIYGSNIFKIDILTLVLMISVTIFFPIFLMNMVVKYPTSFAKIMKIHSLGDIPEILSYLVMYIKLVPNLENSVKFSASESNTNLAKDFRKMLWDMEIRIYHGIDDALTSFANEWGIYSEYFKRSLHLIRSSIQEKDKASRMITLNRALDVSLDGTQDLMNKFANKLHQPAMVIYSIGIMIPLALVAMLPATGLVGLKINIIQIFFLYDIILPTFIFIYTRKILLSRPATFNPPDISDDNPKIKNINKKRIFLVSLIFGIIIALPGIIFTLIPMFFKNLESNQIINFITKENGLNNYFPVTLFIIWGFTVFLSIYTITVYRPYKKVRDNIKQVEREFSDALYILGKRISEEKSPEESFMYTAYTMKGSSISEIFSKTGYNLTALHTNLKDAMFDKEYGSLKHIYSDRIKAIMLLFVEGIKKSEKAVSNSIIKIADHLKALQQVEKKIKDTLFSLTSTLKSTVSIFAPLIGGVTLSITKLISNIITNISNKLPTEESIDLGASLPNISSSFSIENIRPEYFVLVIGIYIIELVLLIVKFTNGIDEGDDKATYMYTLGKTLPVSIAVFSLTVILGQMFFSEIFV